jgi:hypothetical protein
MAGPWEKYAAAPAAQSYDTQLDPGQEKAYRVWMNKIGHTKAAGYRVDDSFSGSDYDYRGFFKKNGPVSLGQGQHLTDEFKKPAHETFSNESQYAVGENAARAGRWEGETFHAPQAEGPWAKYSAPATRPPPIAPEQPQDTRPTGNAYDALIEPVMSIGSSALAAPVAGLSGLAAAGTRALGLTNAEPANVVERVQGAMSYQPRTKAGAVATNVAAYPFEKLAQGADWLGQKAADATDSPAIGATVNTATQMLAPTALLKGAKGVKVLSNGTRGTPRVDPPVAPGEGAPAPKASPAERAPTVAKVSEKPVPSRERLAELAKAAYKKADDAGVVVNENSLKGLKTKVVALTKKEGIDRDLHPDSSAALKKIIQSKGNLTLTEVETLRKVANDAKGSIKPADKRMASMIVDELDDYIDNLKDADVVAGDATKTKALKEARGYYSRMKKSDTISELVERAEVSAPNFSASGLENALRTEFRALAKNSKKMRMFTAEEQAAIRKVAQGGKAENALRFIGKFAPTGVVSGTLAGGLATTLMGPAGLGVPAVGLAGRYAATRMTKKNVRTVDELVRRGPAEANALANKKAEQKRNALADF